MGISGHESVLHACAGGHVLTSANLAGIYPNLDLILLFEGNGLGRESLLGRRRSTC